MSHYRYIFVTFLIFAGIVFSTATLSAQVTAKTVIRVESNEHPAPTLTQEDIVVQQGGDKLPVAVLQRQDPSKAFDLFILIDDNSDFSLASHFDELRDFISSLPAATAVGIGYVDFGSVKVEQPLTTNRQDAGKVLHITRGPGAAGGGNPYLALLDFVQHWPGDKPGRAVLMITDGIDRLHGDNEPYSPDVDAAGLTAQRAGIPVYSIFFRPSGHFGHSFWQMSRGQNSLARLAEDTAGESFYLGMDSPISLKPYLAELGNDIQNQYSLAFQAKPKSKGRERGIKVTTEIRKVEIVSPREVWIPETK